MAWTPSSTVLRWLRSFASRRASTVNSDRVQQDHIRARRIGEGSLAVKEFHGLDPILDSAQVVAELRLAEGLDGQFRSGPAGSHPGAAHWRRVPGGEGIPWPGPHPRQCSGGCGASPRGGPRRSIRYRWGCLQRGGFQLGGGLGVSCSRFPFTRGFRDCKEESGALARLGLNPDRPSMALDNPFADSQPHAGDGIVFAGMQALEDVEYLLIILRLDADAIVPHREHPAPLPSLSADVDSWRRLAVELERITDEVLE